MDSYERRYLKSKEGKEVPIRLSAISIEDAKGREVGQAGFIRDLRHIRSLEDRLYAIVHMGQVMSNTLDLNLDQVLQLVVEAAVAASPNAQRGALHLYDEKTQKGVIRCGHNYVEHMRVVLSLNQILGEKKVIIRILGVTGTIKSAKNKYLTTTDLRTFTGE